jgi:hypothetical protein
MEEFEYILRKILEENIDFIIFEFSRNDLRGCCVCNQMKHATDFPQLFKNFNVCNKCISNFDKKRLDYLKELFENIQKEYLYNNLDEISVKIDKKDYILMKKNPKISVFINKGGFYEHE